LLGAPWTFAAGNFKMLENAVYRYSVRFGQAVSEKDKRWQSYL